MTMNRKLFSALVLIVLGIAVFFVGSPRVVYADGPYYATPSWDQTFPVSTRFVVLANMQNQAVLDKETGLVWTRTSIIFNDFWDYVMTYPPFDPIGGRCGWRLPTLLEIATLNHPGASICPPFSLQAGDYPTSDTSIIDPGYFLSVHFNGATFDKPLSVHGLSKSSTIRVAIFVRGPTSGGR
jgi:hypothetical protein